MPHDPIGQMILLTRPANHPRQGLAQTRSRIRAKNEQVDRNFRHRLRHQQLGQH